MKFVAICRPNAFGTIDQLVGPFPDIAEANKYIEMAWRFHTHAIAGAKGGEMADGPYIQPRYHQVLPLEDPI